MLRFAGFRWTPADPAGEREGRALIAKLERRGVWRRLIDWRGLCVLCSENGRDLAPTVWPNGTGIVFGALFARGEEEKGAAPVQIDAASGGALAAEGGASLTTRFWGGYVAILVDRARDEVHVLRDPTGARACFIATQGAVNLFFSDAADYACMGALLEPDMQYVAGFLVHARITTRRTGLKGVDELLPGERATFARRGVVRALVWRPRGYENRAAALDFATAKRALRQTASMCAAAWGGLVPKALHRLSGGLDSTIVLRLLAEAAPATEIVCANEYSRAAPEGDERAFARIAAAHCGKALLEIEARPEDVRYERALAAPLAAKPSLSIFSYADRSLVCEAKRAGAFMITSGQAGDQLFHRARTPFIAADAVRDRLPAGDCLRVALDSARLSGRSLWGVLQIMIAAGALGRPPNLDELCRPAAPLMRRDVDLSALDEFAAHEWMVEALEEAPGRALRVWRLLDAIHYHDASAMSASLLCTPILLSQPIVELCLKIPTYVMTQGGVERALLRAAFAGDIPEPILRRRAKGQTTRHFAAVLEHNCSFLRDILLDGELVRCGLVDRKAVEGALQPSLMSDGLVASGLLSCAAAEIWLHTFRRACALAKDAKRANA